MNIRRGVHDWQPYQTHKGTIFKIQLYLFQLHVCYIQNGLGNKLQQECY